MKKSLAIAGILGLTAVVVLEAEPPRTLTHPQVPGAEALRPLGLKKRWHAYLPVEGSRDGVAVAQPIDNQFIAQTHSGSVVTLDAETGRTQWRARLDRPYSAHKGDIAYNGRMIFVTSNARMFGIDRATGNIEWSLPLPGILSTGPTADIDRLFVCTAEGRVASYMLPVSQAEARGAPTVSYGGRAAERSINPSTLTKPESLWEYQMDAAVRQPAVVLPTHVVFADGKGTMYSFQKDQRSLADTIKSTSVISAPIAQQGDTIYVASQDHNVYSYQMEVGSFRLRWQYSAGSKVLQKPIVIGDDVCILSELGGLHCVDRETGALRWVQSEARRFAGASKRLICTVDRAGRLLVLDRQKGKAVGTLNTRDFAIIPQNDFSNRVFLTNHDGLLVCLQDLDPSEDAPVYYHLSPKAVPPRPADPAPDAAPPAKPKAAAEEKKEEMKDKEK